eukprot:TRINITY_DN886_c0_g1_i8.p1 TRINITY_DN886_c0_g1~~TRINITY_DN886_c0_g1_i8.p1  ORF type:complete len:412 (+),score=165.99 TRINITY_DN886_c0_g1_i8:34-1269(+)
MISTTITTTIKLFLRSESNRLICIIKSGTTTTSTTTNQQSNSPQNPIFRQPQYTPQQIQQQQQKKLKERQEIRQYLEDVHNKTLLLRQLEQSLEEKLMEIEESKENLFVTKEQLNAESKLRLNAERESVMVQQELEKLQQLIKQQHQHEIADLNDKIRYLRLELEIAKTDLMTTTTTTTTTTLNSSGNNNDKPNTTAAYKLQSLMEEMDRDNKVLKQEITRLKNTNQLLLSQSDHEKTYQASLQYQIEDLKEKIEQKKRMIQEQNSRPETPESPFDVSNPSDTSHHQFHNHDDGKIFGFSPPSPRTMRGLDKHSFGLGASSSSISSSQPKPIRTSNTTTTSTPANFGYMSSNYSYTPNNYNMNDEESTEEKYINDEDDEDDEEKYDEDSEDEASSQRFIKLYTSTHQKHEK